MHVLLYIVGNCAAGHWCMQGVDRQYPNGLNQTSPLNNTCYDDRELGYGGLCFRGYYCPVGTSYPIVCENGTYANVEGLSSCDQCPQGIVLLKKAMQQFHQPQQCKILLM